MDGTSPGGIPLCHISWTTSAWAFDVLQIPYAALQPEHEVAIVQAAKAGAGIVIRGGVARGEPGAGQGAIDVWQRWEQANMGELLEGVSATAFMLRFTLSNPDIHTTIVGTLNPAHLINQENIAAACKGPFPASVYQEARRRLTATWIVINMDGRTGCIYTAHGWASRRP